MIRRGMVGGLGRRGAHDDVNDALTVPRSGEIDECAEEKHRADSQRKKNGAAAHGCGD